MSLSNLRCGSISLTIRYPRFCSAAGRSRALVRVHMAEVFAASFGLSRPGQPNLVLETGEARRAAFNSRQLFIQKLRHPAAALRPFAKQLLAFRALFAHS
jgi:hypothetical protein